MWGFACKVWQFTILCFVDSEYFLFCCLELGENSGLLQPRAGVDASKF